VKNNRLVALGERIRRLREESGASQEEFAMLAEIDRAYYGGIERGERNVSAINLMKIAIALNAEVGNLFPDLKNLKAS
jgi:transcriptional regulator with XRE-family HTH domain